MTPLSSEKIHALGYVFHKTLPNGKQCGVLQYLFTGGLCVGLDEVGFQYRYCYPTIEDAIAGLLLWEGEGHPPGPWIKRKGRGEDLMNPNGGWEGGKAEENQAVARVSAQDKP